MNTNKSKLNFLLSLLPIITIFALSSLYIKTLSSNFNFDGVVYSIFLRNSIITKSPLSFLHYQHLLYQPISYFFYILSPIKLDPLIFLQFESLLFSLLSLVFIYLSLKKLTDDLVFASISLFFLGFSHIFWYYSVEAEVHSLSFLLLSISLYIIIKDGSEYLKLILSGLPVISHVLNSFYTLAYWLTLKTNKIKRDLKQLLLIISIPSTIYIFLFFYLFTKGKFDSFFNKKSVSSLNSFSIIAFFQNIKSFGKFFTANNYSYFFTLIFIIFVLFLLTKREKEKIEIIFLYWVLFAFLFHLFWEPFNPELKSTLFILFSIIFLKEIYKTGNFRYIILLSLITALFFINFSYFKKNSELKINSNYKIAINIKKFTPENSIIIIGGTSNGYIMGKAYIPYFSIRKVLSLESYGKKIGKRDINLIFAKIRKLQSKYTVFILSDCFKKEVSKILFDNDTDFEFFKSKLFQKIKSIYNLGKYKLYKIAIN